jgi:HEAT repeat protein
MRHVFLSYCRDDADFSRQVETNVRQSGFRTWRDQALRAGDDWRIEIDASIRDALAVVVIVSAASIRSAYVNYEWAFALGSGIPVLPVLLEFVDGELPPDLLVLRSLDFRNRAAPPWSALMERLREIEDALRPATVHVPRDTPPVIHEVLRSLDSMDEKERESALSSLGQMDHPGVVEILAEAARHPVKGVRTAAAVQLSKRQDPRAIPELLEALRNRNRQVEPSMLWSIGKAALPLLIGAMGEKEEEVRKWVYFSLGNIGGQEAVTVLIERLHAPSADDRRFATVALKDEPAALPALLEMIHDPDQHVRSAVFDRLVKKAENAHADEQLFTVFLEALDDQYEQIVISAGKGLAACGDPRAIPRLLHTALNHRSENARTFLKNALRRFGFPAEPLREAVVTAEPDVRVRAIEMLRELGDESDLPLFIAASRDKNVEVRRSAVSALEYWPADSAVEVLLERLQDDDPKIARWAVIGLGRKGNEIAVPALMECLNDFELAEVASYSLEEIGTKEARSAVKAWKRQSAK